MPRRVIVHCGLHKTGTTALQHFLTAATEPLRGVGILVPRTGRIALLGGGHHNIAWELNRDRRFDRKLGGVAELVEEIAAFDGDAVISSEDFESSLAVPARLAPLLRHPRLADRQIVLAIYMRDQISYAEGLFTENVGHGFGEECAQVMQDIAARGELSLREWRFQFDYERLWSSASAFAFAPAQCVFRVHCPPSAGGIVADFMGRLFARIRLAPESGEPVKVNPRWNFFQALTTFHGNRIGRRPDEREQAIIRLLAAQVGVLPVLLPTVLRRIFADRFMAGNRAICQAAGLPLAVLDLEARGATPPSEAFLMDRVFSFETTVVITGLAEMLPGDLKPNELDARHLPASATTVILAILEAWRTGRPLP